MKAVVAVGEKPGALVSPMILGQNIETCATTVDGLLSNRLRNPKFVGPPHRMTGIAPEWYGASHAAIAYELTPQAGLCGSEAQLVRTSNMARGPALHQNRIQIREGEDLELEIWARAWRGPVTLSVELKPLAVKLEPYDTGSVEIATPYFKRYVVPLHAPRDDDEARLKIDVMGGGELWFDQIHLRPYGQPNIAADISREIATMQIPILRFPGGIATTTYNWRHGTGPVHLRPDMLDASFHHDWYMHYDFGTDEYLQLCLEQAVTPALTLNIATSPPEEAAAWAVYCAEWFRAQGIDPPLIHWHIGNHPYSPTLAQMTPQMYIDVLKRYIPAVKHNYPSCRIVAVMSSADLDVPDGEAPWRDAILQEASDMVDLIQFQNYGGLGVRPEPAGEYDGGIADPYEQVEQVVNQLRTFETSTRSFIARCQERGVNMKVGIAEWNWWLQASHWDGHDFEEPPLTLHALFAAGMIHRFAALAPTFEVAHFYNLVNCMGIVNRRGANVKVTGVAEVFKLYRPALPGRFVALEIETSTLGAGKTVEGLALKSESATWLFFVNRHPSQEARIELEGVDTDGCELTGLAGEQPISLLRSAHASIDEERLTVPPLSIVRCRMSR